VQPPLDVDQTVTIPCGKVLLQGILHVPSEARGLVLFTHGSGSGRFSVRNQYVANVLQKARLATLLFDLLTTDEETEDDTSSVYRFDIPFLAERLLAATDWVRQQARTQDLPVGYFGASTGGGAALVAAAKIPEVIKAVVSRGGRPDMAMKALPFVKAPTLLIVGGNDEPVIEMNQNALEQLQTVSRLDIIPGATHLFEEDGALQEVARLARDWFGLYLVIPCSS
jgi:putative phosphoribosyl transferase